MKKFIQKRVAESALALPVAGVLCALVWLLAGFFQHQWWLQAGCMVVATYFTVELNTTNVLLRIRSRMVAVSFLMLSCAGGFLFSSLPGAVVTLCFVVFLLLLFRTYQDTRAVGVVYYAFLMLGLASMICVHVLYLLPLLWILMYSQLQSLSFRTLVASVYGLLTPYWIIMPLLLFPVQEQVPLLTYFSEHFGALGNLIFPISYSHFDFVHWALLVYVVLLLVIGLVHFLNKSYEDRVRTRQLYGFFAIVAIACLSLIALQPQHYDWLMRIVIITVSPLVAHFIALTSTKLTNVMFILIGISCLLLIVISVSRSVLYFLADTAHWLWSGLLSF